VSFDFYKINWNNVVASPAFQDIIDASCPAGGPGCPSTAQVIRDSNNQVVTILSNYQNLAERTTSGLDIDARWTVPTEELGKFTLRGNGVYVRSFKEDDVEYAGTNGGTNTIPRIKGALSVDWDYAATSVTLRWNYTRGWHQQALPASWFTAQDPRFQTGTYPEKTPSYMTYDLFGRYQLSKNLSVSGSVINLFNKKPPFDPGFSSTFLYDYSQFDARDRQLRLSVNYKM
jgi:iron complex outermembrane receptor protein